MEIAEPVLGGRKVEIVARSSIPWEMVVRNIEASFARGLPRFHHLPWLGKAAGPVAIIGGGPSLHGELDHLRKFPGPKIGCGSVHDFLVDNGIVPEFHAMCDPEELARCFITNPQRETCYLLASQLDPGVFDALSGFNIRMWHGMLSADVADFRSEPQIGGGDSIVLRAWPLAAVMGHRDFHFFGFDLSFGLESSESQHAYSFAPAAGFNTRLEEPVIATVEHTGERFVTTAGYLFLLKTFMRMLAASYGQGFTHTIHGESLVASSCCKGRVERLVA